MRDISLKITRTLVAIALVFAIGLGGVFAYPEHTKALLVFFTQGGDSFGTTGVLGTNDNFDLSFETNGTERIRIDTAGDFGIGTTSPSSKLHVIGTATISDDTTIGGDLAVTGPAALSGGATITCTGCVTNDNIAGTLSGKTLSGSSTWSGNAVGTSFGGTGLTSLGGGNQILGVNSGATSMEYKTISGTANQVSVTLGAGSIILATPQNIHTGAIPTFAGLTLSGAVTAAGQIESTTGGFKFPDGSVQTTAAGSSGVFAGNVSIDGTLEVDGSATLSGGADITCTGCITSANIASTLSGKTLSSGSVWSGDVIGLAYGGTGASLADPEADRIMFWDDSVGSVGWLTVGSGLTLSGTTLNAVATNDVVLFISPIDAGSLMSANVAYYDVAHSVVAGMADNFDSSLRMNFEVPAGATGISSIKLVYGRDNTGDARLRFRTGYVEATAGFSGQTDTSDSYTQYAGGASDGSIGMITVPSGAYDALSGIESNGKLMLRIDREGGHASDTYTNRFDVVGFYVTFTQ